MPKPTLVWFRQDLRLTDHPALHDAVERGGPVIPVFIWAPDEEGNWPPGAAHRWFIHHALAALAEGLSDRGSKLILRSGPTEDALADLLDQTGADRVVWTRRYEPAVVERDKAIKAFLRDERSVEAESFNGSLLVEPWQVETGSGNPYKVFTPFWKNISGSDRLQVMSDALEAPDTIPSPDTWPEGCALADLELEPERDWKETLAEEWTPSEAGAAARLDAFFDQDAKTYGHDRDYPDQHGTSMLSPHLHHGTVSPRQVWQRCRSFMTDGRRNLSSDETSSCETFLKELGWREFAYHVLFNFPHTTSKPLNDKYADFPWRDDANAGRMLHAWRVGRTGFPIVDAGMRELWHRGWMHNRVRMIVASFLVKDLLISWEDGARHFWDCLCGGDLASNTLGWQWAGGCGADAAPFFRIFNPWTQSEKFDADGDYIRRWVPELAELEGKSIHNPHAAKAEKLEEAGIELGLDPQDVKYAGDATPGRYPDPIVDHKAARDHALDAFETVKGG